ncbi:MAG: ATP-binding cassette domain-containing protein [Patescibacteria group bacterium]|nr:ATP-binding cassette domain-containing protein [Patescibacteria group bacterium]
MSSAVTLEHVSKRYRKNLKNFRNIIGYLLRLPSPQDFWAVDDLTFTARPGEIFGIIGQNGAGKSTVLKILARVTKQTRGTVHVTGRVAALIEIGAGLHPDLTGEENIFLYGAIMGMSRKELRQKFDAIVDFSELAPWLQTPVRFYSSGMFLRLAFAIAIHTDPDILLMDEILAVGDEPFQKKCLAKMDAYRRQNKVIILVSHNLGQVARLCNRALWLENGRSVMLGEGTAVVNAYTKAMSAKTQGLMSDIPWYRREVDGAWDELGKKQLDFLVAHGLQPHHRLLEIGCGSLRGGVHFIEFLAPGGYYGVDKEAALLAAGKEVELEQKGLLQKAPTLKAMDDFNVPAFGQTFDYVWAHAVFIHLSLNHIIQCLMNVDRVLKPGGKFYATFFENPEGKQQLGPRVRQRDGSSFTTYFSKNPYHYDLATFRWMCEGTSLQVENLGDWGHPAHQQMLVFTKRPYVR